MTGDTGIHEQIIGDDNGQGAVRSLVIISTELMETVRSAHLALEDCVDGRGGTAALNRAGELLHQARGALQISETYGAALLVEEMELACKYLASLRAGKGREDGLEALTRAMVQLPVYIERLLSGGRDIALVLLPMLNDLRATRGEPLLSEGTLLLLNLSPSQAGKRIFDREGSGEDPVEVARRLRPKFQLALLGWIKGGENRRHLQTLADVAADLTSSATRDDMYQLWWVVGGVLESLQNGGLETSISIKRLLGQADRRLKYLIDEGLSAFDKHPVDDLLNNLLYYVARSSNAGERISEIRAAFNLAELLPGDEQVEDAREALSAPSARLMQTVGSAIKEDLGRVKDVLDIFVRTGMNKSSELVPQLELLKKISDTLGVLGLGELRGDIEGEIERLKSVVERGGVANDQIILDIASTLLRVEDRLDQQLLRLTLPQDREGKGTAESEEQDEEFRQVAESVMRECIINLARIKETISQSIAAEAPSQGLDSVPSLVRGIKAGLLMLGKPRAMEVVERIGRLVTAMLNSGGPAQLTQRETDRLADAIVSIEYYMETVKAGRSEPWYMLDNAEACLAVLRDAEQRMLQAIPVEAVATGQTMKISVAEIKAEAERALQAESKDLQATEVMSLPVVAPDTEHMDPELLELFIEEAKEEIASIKRNLPVWTRSPDDMESLITARRSFHTLKGSGRMVGAERIGEYCWSVENLLNRLINRTLVRTPPMVNFILEAAEAVPELVEQLEVGTEPEADIRLLMAKANAFAEGDPNAAVLTLRRPETEVPKKARPALEMDPVLYDIFSKETAVHLKVITDYLSACEGYEPPFDVTDKLHRACHTLHGSANMANVDRGVAVASALNRFVRRVYEHKVGFQRSGLAALLAAVRALQTIVEDINNPERERADYSALINHLAALADAVLPGKTPAPEAEAAPATVAPPRAAPEVVSSEPEYDAEIASIFTEESAELLESADKALISWVRERSAQPMHELKRHLHTLKGGARMAGISAMGDLSHELETLLMSIDGGRVKATPAVEDLLQRSIDELHRMRDTVIAGKPVRTAIELVQRIQQANAGFEIADEAEVEVSLDDTNVQEAPSAAFTIEADDTVSMVIVDSPLADELADIGKQKKEEPPLIELPAPEAEPEAELEPESEAEFEPEPEAEIEREPEPQPEPEIEREPEPEPEFEPEPAAAARATADVRPLRAPEQRQEFARVDADLLEDLLNAAGEISIYHSRLNQQISSFEFHVDELEQTIARLREQLRKLEIETEAQIMHGHQDTLVARDFDPLELDRYSNIQQLSRALAESANDLGSLKDLLQSVTTEAEGLLVQQSRVTAELQDGLMRTRMVPFERHVPRLTRLVRQAAQEVGKRAELAVEGASGELDRQVLDKMLPPFEHMLRNAVIHGIESPAERQAAGKPGMGRITIRLHREGAEMVIDVADDGKGLDVDAIRRKAFELDMLKPDTKVTDEEIMSLILRPGFTTAAAVTQSAGRGVGMDVVASEIKKLGGSLRISSVTGQGTNFTVRLPFTLAITQALIVRTGEEVYALPLPTVEGVARIPRAELENLLSQSEPSYLYGEQEYKFRHLGMYLGGQAAKLPEEDTSVPVILVRAGDYSAALLVDEMLASREVVVKAVGPQLAGIRGVSGATILGDGRIILILDINALVRTGAPVVELKKAAPTPSDDRPLALVVDDSITVRRVTERFLHRHGLRVETAKDGLDAISVMQDHKPDIILLDIEMPRMDGYEFASHVRNDDRVSDVPIIMITSRVGDKHRARAIELGVNDYVGKPYQDSQLLEAIRRQLEDRGIELT
ncbi:MAG: Hpt domain-containing protein [Gammaproteobacteria bacterium]|nr:Hpt domain-containing protein [Gammaproteobacteria bacterium]MDH3480445.1 Hpt domain-containing protein [Gammaproteobacteria bacterium]